MAGLSFSEFLGYTSIACWLGAQFPQILENIRNQSTEGLALPFLANWMLGDLSNLIGCILTHQLPFQTYLASYFCMVDLMLVSQFFYYGFGRPSKPSHIRPRSRTTSGPRRASFERGHPRYRTLSAAAANVAAAAALAAQQGEQVEPIYNRTRWPRHSVDRLHDSSQSHDTGLADDVDEEALVTLADSFHSEGGRTSKRKGVSWSQERHSRRGGSVGRIHPSLHITTSELDSANRGRPLQRDPSGRPETGEWTHSMSGSPVVDRTSSRASRRSAGLVFLGVWALFGVGTLAGSRRGLPSDGSTSLGRVLSVGGVPISNDFAEVPVAVSDGSASSFSSPLRVTLPISTLDDTSHESQKHEPASERILGRIFAWLCTTLYLTSRLPQIWKNYARKSVEGLSMYLFVFAFLGNFFYVSSILSNPNAHLPPPASTEFLRESIPYILGSGGTFCFDITIVAQSFVYRPRKHLRGRSSTSRSRGAEEEQTGLLSEDALAHEASGSRSKSRTSSAQVV